MDYWVVWPANEKERISLDWNVLIMRRKYCYSKQQMAWVDRLVQLFFDLCENCKATSLQIQTRTYSENAEQKHYPKEQLNIGYVYTDIAKDKIRLSQPTLTIS